MFSANSGASPWLGAIDSLFLRMYAMNLQRTWRNAPAAAWTDASFTADVLLGLPVLFFAGAAWSLLMDLAPRAVGASGMPDWAVLILVIASWLAVDVPLSRRWRVYKKVHAASDLPAPADSKYIIVLVRSLLRMLYRFVDAWRRRSEVARVRPVRVPSNNRWRGP